MEVSKVVVMGLGYIGLPTAALIASKQINVHGVDVNNKVVATINKGKIHIIEPDLEGLVDYTVSKKYLTANLTPVKADVFIVAVPTPFKKNHEPDISYVESSINMILPCLEEKNLIIIESTSPIGTTKKISDLIFSKRPELKNKIHIAYCPERVLPGKVIYELESNDRVIGGINEESTENAVQFYSIFVKGMLHKTNARTAEMCKLVENSSRDVSIAFANELSIICDKANINVWELIDLANKHPRVNILKPGVGVGGHCIAVDPWFIVHDYREEAKIIRNAREINNYKSQWVVEKIKNASLEFEKKNNKKPVIACMGLAFKPDIDDLRESPALFAVKELIKQKIKILPVEPNVDVYDDFEIVEYNEAVSIADIIVFLVAHREFKKLEIGDKIVYDFCGIGY